MKKVIFYSIIATLFLSGCAETNTANLKIRNNMKKINTYVKKNSNNTLVKNNKVLPKKILKVSPFLAKKYKKKALEVNAPKTNNFMPLYRKPLFAQMVVFPYAKNGIYHGYQEIWIKIKDGEFVLAQPTSNYKKDKIFDYNEVSK